MVESDAKGFYSIKANPATEVLEIFANGYSKGVFMLSGLSNYDFTLSSSGNDIIVMAGMMIKRPVPEKKPVLFIPVKIAGNIISQNGDAIPYASVKIVNSHTGIMADAAGKFSITVNDSNSKVEISATGYSSKIIDASLTDLFTNVVLENAISQTLDSLIVTGYETKRVSCVTGAVASVKGEMLATTIIKKTSFTQALKQILPFKQNEIKVYPSPVTRGSAFSVAISSKQNGSHSIQIIYVQGRVLMKEQVMINAKQQTIQLHCDEKWSAGIYFIRVFNTNNTLLSTNSFSVQ